MDIQGFESTAVVGGQHQGALIYRGEDQCALRLRGYETDDQEQDGGVLRQRSADAIHSFYRTNELELEYDLLLLKRPASHIFTFDIECSPGVEFLYQPALTKEESTHARRPERVVGSYAVYGAWGKLGHLFRPLLIDADGNTSWGRLQLRGRVLDLVANPAWLWNARYPVTVDPTIGLSTVGGTRDNPSGYIVAGVFVAPSAGVSPSTYNAWVDNTNTTQNLFIGGVYPTSAGSPASQTLIAATSTIGIPANTLTATKLGASIAWNTISNGVSYALAWNSEELSEIGLYFDTGGSQFNYFRAYDGTMPATYDSDPTPSTTKWAVSVDYSTAGGGTHKSRMMMGFG